ncbi:hypothetical protein M885DRAFT_551656 [Pelagophyceae sp. CCMP2097]|nr:hypothetical protein M885DRAFT_551656 [Pelagophyceae sp. CCMP2097]
MEAPSLEDPRIGAAIERCLTEERDPTVGFIRKRIEAALGLADGALKAILKDAIRGMILQAVKRIKARAAAPAPGTAAPTAPPPIAPPPIAPPPTAPAPPTTAAPAPRAAPRSPARLPGAGVVAPTAPAPTAPVPPNTAAPVPETNVLPAPAPSTAAAPAPAPPTAAAPAPRDAPRSPARQPGTGGAAAPRPDLPGKRPRPDDAQPGGAGRAGEPSAPSRADRAPSPPGFVTPSPARAAAHRPPPGRTPAAFSPVAVAPWEADHEYGVALGESWRTAAPLEFVSMSYGGVVPAHVAYDEPASAVVDERRGEITVERPSGGGGVSFRGAHARLGGESTDCVLVFDGGAFRLERLAVAVRLQHVRNDAAEKSRQPQRPRPLPKKAKAAAANKDPAAEAARFTAGLAAAAAARAPGDARPR